MEGKKLTPKKAEGLEKSRTLSDANLLEHGAEYIVDKNFDKRLDATEDQITQASFEMDNEKLKQRLFEFIDNTAMHETEKKRQK